MNPSSYSETPDGQWLRENRRKCNMRQTDVAEIFHIHSGRVCEWERGQHPIPSEVKRKLEEVFRDKRNKS